MERNLFQIGDPGPSSQSSQSPRAIYSTDEVETCYVGERIAPLNDYCMIWDEDCVKPSQLEPWRREGDDLCDDVVRLLDLKPGQDGLQKLLDHLEGPEEEQAQVAKDFWEQMSRLPPDVISAIPEPTGKEPLEAFPVKTGAHPNYAPPPTLSEGQAVFWRYSAEIFSALLHFSLAGGFSAVRVLGVLRETNYLTGDARDSTYRRLLETTQFVLDAMNDMTPITGQGWKSAVRVRMLHSTVRVRIMDKKGIKNVYSIDDDGVPINQEDLLATLGSFAVAPLWSLRRMGVTLSREEEGAYLAVWRHIGYYLGVSPDRLRKYFDSNKPSTSHKVFTCLILHLFAAEAEYTDYRQSTTYRVLSAVSNRPPRYTPVDYHLATSRILLGDGLADRLALPVSSAGMVARVKLGFYLQWSLIAFGRVWRPSWEVERVTITRTLVTMIVSWQLGERRTRFVSKPFGALSDVGKNDPDWEDLDPTIPLGPEAGKRIVARWKWLLVEMGGLLALTGASGLAVAWGVWTSCRRY